jgi:hypothetical protein
VWLARWGCIKKHVGGRSVPGPSQLSFCNVRCENDHAVALHVTTLAAHTADCALDLYYLGGAVPPVAATCFFLAYSSRTRCQRSWCRRSISFCCSFSSLSARTRSVSSAFRSRSRASAAAASSSSCAAAPSAAPPPGVPQPRLESRRLGAPSTGGALSMSAAPSEAGAASSSGAEEGVT